MIIKRVLSILILTVPGVLVCVPAAAQTTASQAPDEEQHLRVLLREGAQLLRDGKYDDARKYLLDAWQIRPSPDVGAVLGQAELLVGLYRDAATHLDWTLKNFSPARPEKALQSVRDLFAQAMTHVAVLRTTVNRQGVEVRVDGQTVGTAPLGSDVFVDPGKHVISAGPASGVGEQSVLAEAGQTYTLTLDVAKSDAVAHPVSTAPTVATPVPMPADKAPVQPTSVRSLDMTPVYWTLAVGGGLTAGSMVAALLFHGHAASKESDARSIRGQAGNCQGASRAQCEQLVSLMQDRNSANTKALVAVSGAAVFAVATGIVTYVVWPRSDARGPVQPVAWASPGSAGVGFLRNF